jgi:hypothetical protein
VTRMGTEAAAVSPERTVRQDKFCIHVTIAVRACAIAALRSVSNPNVIRPGTVTGRNNVDPAVRSRQSMFPPPAARGGMVECCPGSFGGIPITPRNGAVRTV